MNERKTKNIREEKQCNGDAQEFIKMAEWEICYTQRSQCYRSQI